MQKILTGLLVVSLFAFGCGSDEDMLPPTLSIIEIEPSPTAADICGAVSENVILLKGGDTFRFELLAKDDKGLSQYKVDLHQNFDCHGHKSNPTTDWERLIIKDLTGTEQLISESFKVPETVTAGNYHFQVSLVDAAGNEMDGVFVYDLKVQNTDDTVPPILSIAEPTTTTFSLNRGAAILFRGSITDNTLLAEGENARLILRYLQRSTGNVLTATTYTLPQNAGTNYDFELNYTVPMTWTKGDYVFLLDVYDGVNNQGNRKEFEVEIL